MKDRPWIRVEIVILAEVDKLEPNSDASLKYLLRLHFELNLKTSSVFLSLNATTMLWLLS
jgi:hypothetical protein